MDRARHMLNAHFIFRRTSVHQVRYLCQSETFIISLKFHLINSANIFYYANIHSMQMQTY